MPGTPQNGAQAIFENRPDGTVFILMGEIIFLMLEDYISYNNISHKNEYLVLKCLLKGEVLLWLKNIGKFLVNDDVKIFLVENTIKDVPSILLVDFDELDVSKIENDMFKEIIFELVEMFSDKLELTHVPWNKINTGSAAPVSSKLYDNDKVKQGIIDYHIQKMLTDDIIRPI